MKEQLLRIENKVDNLSNQVSGLYAQINHPANNLTDKDKAEIISCVMEIKFILENGLDEGYEAVNSATINGFSYDNDDDLYKDFKKIQNLDLKLEALWKS